MAIDTEEIAQIMSKSRAETRELFDLILSESDLRRPPSEGFRPLLWHLGHVGAFEEYWLLQRMKGNRPISPHYNAIFDPIKTPKEDSSNLPPIREIESYLDRVRKEVLGSLTTYSKDDPDPMLRDGYVFNLVIEHEYQHQETLAYLFQMLATESKRRVAALIAREELSRRVERLTSGERGEMVRVAGGPFVMGSYGYPFAYDNEKPPRTIELADFRIDRYPVTNADFARFIAEGGYEKRALWSEEGWRWKEENQITCPLYWSLIDRASLRWRVREMFEEADLQPDLPVVGVSWYEAESFARFAGKRMPTEAEWEKAASWDPEANAKRRFSWGDEPPRPELANFNNHYWGPTPVAAFLEGRSAYGCMDMTGNVWEWTATAFTPYPGFVAYPYTEYSELWFDGDHRVLKGGSWATRPVLLRSSFRNFFRAGFRDAFAGFRCAAD